MTGKEITTPAADLARQQPDEDAIRSAFNAWAWQKDSPPLAYMSPGEAARAAFVAGMKWGASLPAPLAATASAAKPPECPSCGRTDNHTSGCAAKGGE